MKAARWRANTFNYSRQGCLRSQGIKTNKGRLVLKARKVICGSEIRHPTNLVCFRLFRGQNDLKSPKSSTKQRGAINTHLKMRDHPRYLTDCLLVF